MWSSKYIAHKSSCVAAEIDYSGLDSNRWVTILDDCIAAINQAIAELTAAEAIEALKFYAKHYGELRDLNHEHADPQRDLCYRRCQTGCLQLIKWLGPVAQEDALYD